MDVEQRRQAAGSASFFSAANLKGFVAGHFPLNLLVGYGEGKKVFRRNAGQGKPGNGSEAEPSCSGRWIFEGAFRQGKIQKAQENIQVGEIIR